MRVAVVIACVLLAAWAVASSGPTAGPGRVQAARPLSAQGLTISCLPAGAGDGGCVTSGTQTLDGRKRFPGGIETNFADAGALKTDELRVAGSANVSGNATISGDLAGAYVYSLTYLFSNNLRARTGGSGLSLHTNRAASDPGPDITFQNANARDPGTYAVKWYLGEPSTQVIAGIGSRGEVIGGGSVEASADFLSLQQDPTHPTLSCSPGPPGGFPESGCYLSLVSGIRNSGFHGGVVIGNGGPLLPDGGYYLGTSYRDGGLALQIFGGSPRSSAALHSDTTTAIDVRGNLWTADGMWQSAINTADLPICKSTLDFDAVFKGPGMFGFNPNTQQMKLCTTTSATADAGYESVCTDRNSLCGPLVQADTNTFSSGTRSVTFTVAYSSTPRCTCTASGNACKRTAVSTTGATFAGTGTEDFDWICVGAR